MGGKKIGKIFVTKIPVKKSWDFLVMGIKL